jgi:hypothetical protein
MSPDFSEIVDDEDPDDDVESLRYVHDLLVSADPPPPISEHRQRPPKVAELPCVSIVCRRLQW